MITRRLFNAVIPAVVAVAGISSPAIAVPITFAYVAESAFATGNIPAGTQLHGEYTFESTAMVDSFYVNLYPDAVIEWTLYDESNTLLARTTDADIFVGDQQQLVGSDPNIADSYSVSSFRSEHEPAMQLINGRGVWTLYRMDLLLKDRSAAGFDGSYLPLLAPSLDVFSDRPLLNLGFTRPNVGATFAAFELISLDRVTPLIPEPTSSSLVGVLVACACWRPSNRPRSKRASITPRSQAPGSRPR